MPVEVGEVEVVARAPESNGARPADQAAAQPPAAAPAPAPAVLLEIAAHVALERSRDLRLDAD